MEHSTPTRTAGTWLPCADGLRATAAVLVFFQHASFLTGAMFQSQAGGILARFDVAPTIFFALSGFLLARPYAAAILDGRPLPDIASFYRRRVLRIVPAYWVALIATYAWLKPESATKAQGIDYPLHFLFLQIYPGNTFPKGISPAWTLAVEVSFYATLPLMAMAGAYLVRGLRGPSQRAIMLLGIITALTIVSLVYRSIVYAVHGPLQSALWLPGTFCEFALGLSAAVLAVWSARRPVAAGAADALGRHDLLWWAIAAALIVFSASQLGLARGLDHANWNRELFGEFARMGAAGLMLLPVAFGPQDRGVIRFVLRSWPIQSLGVISYGFFLWHVPVIEVVMRRMKLPQFLGPQWASGISILSPDVVKPVAATFVIACGFGALSWFLVEKPFIRNRKARAAAAVAPTEQIVEQAAP